MYCTARGVNQWLWAQSKTLFRLTKHLGEGTGEGHLLLALGHPHLLVPLIPPSPMSPPMWRGETSVAVARVAVVATPIASGVVAVVNGTPAVGCPAPARAAAVAPSAAMVVVAAGAAVPAMTVVGVALSVSLLSQGVPRTVAPEEFPTGLPVGRCIPPATVEEEEVLHHIHMELELIVEGPLVVCWWVMKDLVAVVARQRLLTVRINNG